MARLGDFIGTVLADIAQARVKTDLEAVRIAQAYAGDELLRHMPIPRFRIPDISLDVPVIVDTEQSFSGDQPTPMFDQPESREITNIVRRSLTEAGIKLTYSERRKIYYAAQKKSNQLFTAGPVALLNTSKFAKEIENVTKTRLQTILKEKEMDPGLASNIITPLAALSKNLILGKLLTTDRLQIKVASLDIKEFADPENLVRVHMSISEDAFEILPDEDDTHGSFKLVPE